MRKDFYLRIIFIPLLGVFLPLVSGLIRYSDYSNRMIAVISLYFIIVSAAIWFGCNWIHTTLRPLYLPYKHLLRRIIPVCVACALYGGCIGCLSAFGWTRITGQEYNWSHILGFILACMVTVIVFTLYYEILFLTREREHDWKKVSLLHRQRSEATVYALQNEMDPHFLFNALTTLNQLIAAHPEQAQQYNQTLAEVYKYFLLNKNKNLVPLQHELDFLSDYFFLLQLRYENKLQLDVQIGSFDPQLIRIPPCSLQILIENAIKHNSFSEEEPLAISIIIKGQYIQVANKVKPKPFLPESTQIGLNNLEARYKLLFNKNIIIHPGHENYMVALPIIR